MDEILLSLLLEADDPNDTEYPSGFNWEGEVNRVRALRAIVEGIVGRRFEIDDNVQDASFFADLGLYEEHKNSRGSVVRQAVLAVRFSCFGNLFTVWSTCHDSVKLSQEVIDAVIKAVSDRGYTYVPAEELDSEYNGTNPHLRGSSWWIRFFDYL